MLPAQVRYFENLFLLSLCLGVVISALNWNYFLDFATPGYILFIQFSAMFFSLLLILSVSRLRSNIARWILVILFIAGIAIEAFKLGGPYSIFAFHPLAAGLSAVQFLMQATAVLLIVHPDTGDWIKG